MVEEGTMLGPGSVLVENGPNKSVGGAPEEWRWGREDVGYELCRRSTNKILY